MMIHCNSIRLFHASRGPLCGHTQKKTNKKYQLEETRKPETIDWWWWIFSVTDCLIRCRRGRCCCCCCCCRCCCWCGVCGHRQQHRRMAGCQVAVPGTRFPLLIPVPVTVPNSHFPQFPFPSRVSNNFAKSGGLKHERASHTKDIHRYTHTHLYMYMCACIV